ncbi:small subunit ribosomal protein S24e [Nematocida minor]|uniref:small subunit ribosomal protein S24e n=1 Tax=Nematocida minor TaxID=1912983 RepID=UPI00221F7F08|nr:small subunit ribosomal protein S24e [Nematocida minor]KAI5189454.1 small subunit ribosomal protein S24e [Nematocida minor]
MSNTIKILEKKQNPLLDRMELSLSIYHPTKGTPNKKDVSKILSEQMNVSVDNIIIKDCYTRFGTHISTAQAKIYNKKLSLEKIEHKFILNRIQKEKDGKEITKLPRKIRKEEKNKKKKIRGTLAALQKKAEKRQQRNS